MGGFFFFGVLFLIFFIISAIIMPWINKSRISDLEGEVRLLKGRILQLSPSVEVEEGIGKSSENKPDSFGGGVFEQPNIESAAVEKEKSEEVKSEPLAPVKPKSKIGFEQQFGAMLPVWIGGIALALAGFFLVKYSIEQNLISPAVRVILGGIFGVGLLYAGKWVRNKPDFANGIRISQSLTGAGIAVLYVSSYAASKLYGVIPVPMGFLLMAGVTATALVLSLRHGPPIALLGMAGGFLTPALMSTGGHHIFSLFIYLYFTASGLMIVIRKTKWWWMSIPTIIASLLWVVVWILTKYQPGDSIYLFLFLMGMASTIVISSKNQYEQDVGGTKESVWKLSSILNYMGLGGTLLIMGFIGGKAGFGNLEWGLFALLAMGGIGLAYFNDKLYGFVPWVSMAVSAVMLYSWHTNNDSMIATTIAIFAAIYIASGYLLMFRSSRPITWAGLAEVASVSYYLLAYYKLRKTMLFADISLFWGGLAFVLAAIAVYVLVRIYDKLSEYPYRNNLYAIFTVTATTFTSLALFIELDREFLSVAIAVQILALSWVNNKVLISSLRPIIAVIACIFALLLMPQILLMFQLTAYSIVEAKFYLQKAVPIVNWPLFQLGVPALMFICSGYLLRKRNDNRLVRIFEYAALALVAVMGYYLTRNAINPDKNVLFIKVGFFERGVITNILFAYGLLCLVIGRFFERTAFTKSGIVLCGIAIFRIAYFDMFIYNPLWTSQKIEGVVIFNSLLIPFGIPIIWSYFAMRELKFLGEDKWLGYVGAFVLAAIFALITLNVRHVFHGEYLNKGITTDAEIYSYSAAWLTLGIVLLFGGLIKKDKMLRYASLSVILFSVAKVFLYDASKLEGLFRVVSFLGLGICLIGLSYFYTRFVFGKEKEE